MAPRKTHCLNGHPKTPENVTKGNNCRICMAARVKAYREDNRDDYNKKRRGYTKKARAELQDQYINALIRAKTGIPSEEITDEDRKEFRARVQAYRDKQQAKREQEGKDERGTDSRDNEGAGAVQVRRYQRKGDAGRHGAGPAGKQPCPPAGV